MCHECLLPTWIKSCGTFLRLAVVRLDLNNMCRHKAFYEQIGAGGGPGGGQCQVGPQRLRAEAQEVAARQRHQEQQIGNGGPALRLARTGRFN